MIRTKQCFLIAEALLCLIGPCHAMDLGIDLTSCPNSLSQAFTTTNVTSINTVLMAVYSTLGCGGGFLGYVNVNGGYTLKPSGQFNYCSDFPSVTNVPGEACAFPGASDQISIRGENWTTNLGSQNINGNCMNVICAGVGGPAVGWSTQATNTLAFN